MAQYRVYAFITLICSAFSLVDLDGRQARKTSPIDTIDAISLGQRHIDPSVRITPTSMSPHLIKRSPGQGSSRPLPNVTPFTKEEVLAKADRKSTFHHNMMEAFPKPGKGTMKDYGALRTKWVERQLDIENKIPYVIEQNHLHYTAKVARLRNGPERSKAARHLGFWQQLLDETRANHAQRSGLITGDS